MAERIKNMTQGAPMRLILFFALPLMAGNVFQQLYTVVDTAVVGKFIGIDALSALGAAEWTIWLYYGAVQGIAQGFSILMAQYFGAKDQDQLNRAIGASLSLSLVSVAAFLVLSQLTAAPLLHLLNTPAAIFSDALLYLRMMLGGLPIVMFYNLLSAILRAMGDSKTPLYAMIAASLINVGLDLLFVVVFRWGIAGAAAATLIAQLASILYCAVVLKKIPQVKFSRRTFLPSGGMTRSLFRLGIPISFQNIIIAIGGMVVQFVINGYGINFIAGFTAANRLYGILEVAAISFGHAVTSYVGQNHGAKRLDRIRTGMRAALGLALLTAAVIGTLMMVLGRHILGLFVVKDASNAGAVLDIAYQYLFIMALFLPVLYILHIYRSALMGLGNTVVPMASGIAELVMRLGVALLLPLLIGQIGIFFAEVAAWAAAAILLVLFYYRDIQRLFRRQDAASHKAG